MWPNIKRENKIGKSFDEDFWAYWGPSSMFFFNQNLFNDEKEIKSIYFMYVPCHEIKFNPEEIAMGIIYQCGDFGEHTALFSYSELPNIEHNKHWDFCVFPEVSTDIDTWIQLKESWIKNRQGKLTERQVYREYLEYYLFQNYIPKEEFREKSENIIEEYRKLHPDISCEEAYIRLLEKLGKKSSILNYENRQDWIKRCAECCKNGDKVDFDKLILEFINKVPDKPKEKEDDLQKHFERISKAVKSSENNDLNSIFRNCRDYFVDKVVKFEERQIDEIKYDQNLQKYIKTGKKEKAFEPIEGKIVKKEDGKLYFERNEPKYNFRRKDKIEGLDLDDFV